MPGPRTSTRRTLTTALVATAALATPAIAVPAQAQAAAPATRISWNACPDAEFEGMQCGTLRVPVDYARPRTGSLTLALVRRPADDRARREGTLLLNNGAGGSTIEQLRLAMRISFPSFAGAMSRTFDLVAVDPRGVGHSTPIRCTTPLKPAGITHFPRSRAQFDTLVAHNRAFAADCLRANGPWSPTPT
jgi:pimeloyl-ACP methyl ester carboxylesterase